MSDQGLNSATHAGLKRQRSDVDGSLTPNGRASTATIAPSMSPRLLSCAQSTSSSFHRHTVRRPPKLTAPSLLFHSENITIPHSSAQQHTHKAVDDANVGYGVFDAHLHLAAHDSSDWQNHDGCCSVSSPSFFPMSQTSFPSDSPASPQSTRSVSPQQPHQLRATQADLQFMQSLGGVLRATSRSLSPQHPPCTSSFASPPSAMSVWRTASVLPAPQLGGVNSPFLTSQESRGSNSGGPLPSPPSVQSIPCRRAFSHDLTGYAAFNVVHIAWQAPNTLFVTSPGHHLLYSIDRTSDDVPIPSGAQPADAVVHQVVPLWSSAEGGVTCFAVAYNFPGDDVDEVSGEGLSRAGDEFENGAPTDSDIRRFLETTSTGWRQPHSALLVGDGASSSFNTACPIHKMKTVVASSIYLVQVNPGVSIRGDAIPSRLTAPFPISVLASQSACFGVVGAGSATSPSIVVFETDRLGASGVICGSVPGVSGEQIGVVTCLALTENCGQLLAFFGTSKGFVFAANATSCSQRAHLNVGDGDPITGISLDKWLVVSTKTGFVRTYALHLPLLARGSTHTTSAQPAFLEIASRDMVLPVTSIVASSATTSEVDLSLKHPPFVVVAKADGDVQLLLLPHLQPFARLKRTAQLCLSDLPGTRQMRLSALARTGVTCLFLGAMAGGDSPTAKRRNGALSFEGGQSNSSGGSSDLQVGLFVERLNGHVEFYPITRSLPRHHIEATSCGPYLTSVVDEGPCSSSNRGPLLFGGSSHLNQRLR